VANSPDRINKRQLSVRIGREWYRRLQRAAQEKKMGFNQFIRFLIYEATNHVTLTKEDFEIIERERNADLDRSRSKRRLPKG
jgi:uncharacterized protein (DUF1778 family)